MFLRKCLQASRGVCRPQEEPVGLRKCLQASRGAYRPQEIPTGLRRGP